MNQKSFLDARVFFFGFEGLSFGEKMKNSRQKL